MSDAVTKDSTEIQYPPSIVDDVTKLVQRVQTFTGATGAAIALREGEDMVCRASRGNNAPDVGMMMNLDGTFTGLAVTGMKAVRCDDAENDSRVDPEVSRALHIKSMAVVPVLSGMRVTGVIATFSSMGSAFSDTHMAVLKTMADGLGANILRWTESQGIAIPMPAPKPPVKVITAPIPVAKPEAPKPAPVIEMPSKIEAPPAPPVAVATTSAAAAAPAQEKPQPKKPENKLQGKWKPVAPPKEEEKPAAETKPAPKIESKPEPKPEPKIEKKAQPAPAPSFSYAATDESESKKSPMLFAGIGAAVLVVAVGGFFMFGHSSKSSASTSAPVTSTSMPASTTPATTTPVATTTTSSPATGKPEAPKTSAEKIALEKHSPVVDTTTTLRPAASPLIVASTPAAPAPKASADVAPPSINIASASGPALDVPFNTSAPKLSTPAPANAVIVPSRLVQRVNPIYPSSAKQYRIEGAVSLSATIGPDGRVKDAKVLSGPPMLRESAVSAVKQWKYSPSTVNGRSVESSVNIVLQFKMP